MKQRRKLRKLNKIVRKIRRYQKQIKEFSDAELSHLTVEFKERLADGESLDHLLPEAFAAICEADYRVLGMAPYDVQILGGIALHKGYLAEMNTGEGKTLVATMPLYLNALTGKSVILVTVNDYLAKRDAKEMGQVYQFMGLTVSAGGDEEDAGNVGGKYASLKNMGKKEMYAADIVYTTHSALGFDYLLNNLVTRAEDRFLREFYYVIIDEADSVLLDGAQTPLVISSSPRVQSNLYGMADFFVTTMEEDKDYERDEKAVWLTAEGIRYAETFFQIENFYSEEYFEINRHQALEAKEGVELSQENRSVAAVTFQNLFLMFPKMAGMSGTMIDASDELLSVYGAKVLVIPPNRPRQRVDLRDQYFPNKEKQIQAAVVETLRCHEAGRPVLVVAANIVDTESVSSILLKEKIPHNVLNANNASWEAQIIKEAGQPGAVTVATSMAGRGTDIKLGEGVEELGGLAVIGIGRMENVRMERQARGRAGRQGDVGTSQFFVSLEDGVVDGGTSGRYDKYIEGKRRIGRRKLKKIIDRSQTIGEEAAVLSRKNSVDYDKVMQRQRNLVYATRDHLLDGGNIEWGQILRMAGKNIRRFFDGQESIAKAHPVMHATMRRTDCDRQGMDKKKLTRYILDHISYKLEKDIPDPLLCGREVAMKYLLDKVGERLESLEENLGPEDMNTFVRIAVLSAIDNAWVEQVDYMHQLQAAVSGRSTAQRNLLFEYQNEAFDSFAKMKDTVFESAMRSIMLSNVYVDDERKLHIVLP